MLLDILQRLLLLLVFGNICLAEYFGKDLGKLSEFHHGVKGHVYAVDGRTVYIKGFHYDGEGPVAYFYVGNSKTPTNTNGAQRLRDERGSTDPLKRYRGKDITLTLPEGVTLQNIKWLAVWCDEYAVNFGDVRIPRNFDYPKPLKIGSLGGVHGVSSDPIVIVDAQTLLVPNFSYDGEAPDAKFWVGRGEKPSPQGIRIADENGKMTPLRKYDRKTIVLTLPGDLTIFEIGHFGVWCEAFTVDFGHIKIPQTHTNVPPSLKMLGVSPQSKLNCEVLYDDLAFEVRWAVAGDSIVLQLVAKLEDGEYMSFGLSGDPEHTQMVGGDATVAWVDKDTLKGYAYDYYLDAKSQCAGVRGSCPDEVLGEKTNSVRLLNAAMVNGYSIVTYQRPLKAADELDRTVITNGSQPIIWAIGPLNSKNEVSYHSHFTKGDKLLEFGRPPVWNCPMPESEEDSQDEATSHNDTAHGQFLQETSKPEEHKPIHINNKPVIKPNPVPTPKPVAKMSPWYIPPITCNEPDDGVFYAQMGPTGGKQGYPAITGHVGWGISWYINGLLIPEITLVRGKKYTFVTEGGSNPDIPAKYHPFYITDDPIGGYEHKTAEEKSKTKIFAGVRRTRTGELVPIGVGRSCYWTPDNEGPDADEFKSFGAYQRTLTLVCEEGNPGIVTFTPDHKTPDTVYYQCFTHRYLGWKIHIVDKCDEPETEASEKIERISLPDDAINHDDLLQGEESIVQVESRVKPDSYDYGNGYNEIDSEKRGIPQPYPGDTLTGEVSYNPQAVKSISQVQLQEMPLTSGQMKQVIDSVEDLESKLKQEFDNRPVYQHSTLPTTQVELDTGSKDSVPERPVREDEEVQIDAGIPSTLMLPPNQKPLTLQAYLRPQQGKPPQSTNQQFKKPQPPEIKQRRPINPKPQFPARHPYVAGVSHNTPFKKMPLKPPGQRYQPTNMHHPPGLSRPQHPQIYNQSPNVQQAGIPPQSSQQPYKTFKGAPPKHTIPNAPVIVMAKPANVQTLQIGPPAMYGSHVVKSKITLPGSSDVNPQQSVSHPFVSHALPGNAPLGQIIMGKPIENPMPLDQQMIQTKVQIVRVPATTTTEYALQTEPDIVKEIYYRDPNEMSEMKSSDFLGESKPTEPPPPLPTAINTGFKPETIVIESGFKPIIREPLMANEDRIADIYDNNRREDVNMEDEYEDDTLHLPYNYIPSEKMTETFEPIFIPSPPDKHQTSENVTNDLFIKNNLKTDVFPNIVYPSNHAVEERPHPVYKKEYSEINRKTNNTLKQFAAAENNLKSFYVPPSTTKATTTTSTTEKLKETTITVEKEISSSISSIDDIEEKTTTESILKIASTEKNEEVNENLKNNHEDNNIIKPEEENYPENDDSGDYSLFSSLLKELNMYDDPEDTKANVYENDKTTKDNSRRKRETETKSVMFDGNRNEAAVNSAVTNSAFVLSIVTGFLCHLL